jgi:hypothetical protein
MRRAFSARGFSIAGTLLLCAGCSSEEPTGAAAPFPTSSGADTVGGVNASGAPLPTDGAPSATTLPSATPSDVAPTASTGAPSAPVETGVPQPPEPPVDPLANADVGSKVIHRLSNVEYDNTVAHLLGTESRFEDVFLREEAEGFDNIATSLSMSPRQVEDYFVAARELAEEVLTTPELRSRILKCTLDEDPDCARTSIEAFGKRAFRRPLEQAELDRLLATYQSAIDLGESSDGAMQHVLHVALAAPQFLYRIEFDPAPADGTPHPLTAWELASRLSYALWSSMPDEQLFSAAEAGMLSTAAALDTEIDRMLADERSQMLSVNFAGQWLGSRRLTEHVASETVYPEWSPELAQSMQREMELYFSEFSDQDLPFSEFLSTDINFVDDNLREHYGVEPSTAAGFERVTDSSDERSGFLGLAGFLTHTSRETRTSPIIRGSWLLNAFWCLSLKVPANLVVEPLPEPEEGSEPMTVREVIAAHRADPACSGCHDIIDPIGLSLEHFDGTGRYRSEYEDGQPIDSTGELPTGDLVDGLETLSAALANNDEFLKCAARKFHTFALGRAEADGAYLNDTVTRWTSESPTLKNMIKATLTSNTFTMRRAESP